MQKDKPKTTIEHKIGKVTYLVSSAPSEKATDTIDKKIAKMIRKEVIQRSEIATFQ
jgi:hypothetical protein